MSTTNVSFTTQLIYTKSKNYILFWTFFSFLLPSIPPTIPFSRDLHIPFSLSHSLSLLSLTVSLVSPMALMLFLVLLLAWAGRSSAVYCICKDGISEAMLQKALDYACGAGADCNPILQNGVCYNPNTVKSHCDYAVNSYFQRKGQVTGSCDFAGAAAPSNVAPAQSSACVYQSSPSSTGGTNTPTTGPPTTLTPPTTTTPSTTTPSTNTPTITPPSTYIPGTTPSVFGTGLGPSSFTNTDPNFASAHTLHKHITSVPILYTLSLTFLMLQV